MKGEGLYQRLPHWSQHLALSAAGLAVNSRRYGGEYALQEEKVERRGRQDHAALCAFRDQRLAEFVRDAWRHSSFWRDRFDRLGVEPGDILGLEALRQLPVLDKAEAREATARITSNGDWGRRQQCHTSGSTGAGLVFPASVRAMQEQWAVWWRYRRWHGLERDTWCAWFGGRRVVPGHSTSRPWRVNHPARQVMFSTHHMNDARLPAYVAELRRRKLRWIHGYPSALSLLAEAVLAMGGDLGYAVEAVTCGAENLTEAQRARIERAFGVTPRQHYGVAEGVANISECPAGALHVDEDFAAVEFLDDPESGLCRIVGTNLSNPAFPLIRYSVGDFARLGGQCSCGRPGRIVASIDGRLEDYLELSDGSRVGRLDHIFKDLVHVTEAQFEQHEPGHALLRLVRDSTYSGRDEARLRQALDAWLGERCGVEIRYVERIARTANGKLRLVRRHAPEPAVSTADTAAAVGADDSRPSGRPSVVFAQCAPSQLDACFYAALGKALDDDMLLALLNEGGGTRTAEDPELGLVPRFPELEHGYPVRHLPAVGRGGTRNLLHLVSKLRPRILVLQDQPWRSKLVLALVARLRGVKTVMRSDKNRLSALARHGLRLQLERHLVRTLFQGLAPASQLTADYYAWPENAPTWPLPYPSSQRKFAPGPAWDDIRGRIRREHAIPVDAPVFLAVVKFVERENPTGVLDAFARVVARRPDAMLLLVGAGPLEKALHARVARKRISNVHFTGYIPFADLHEVFWASDVFVHLAHVEPWGASVQDALIARMKVVTTDRVGAGVVHLNGALSRFLVPSAGGAHEAATAMIEALDMPQAVFEPAWQRTSEAFTAEALAQSWVRRLCELQPAPDTPELVNHDERQARGAIAFHDAIASKWAHGYGHASFSRRLDAFRSQFDTALSPGEHWLDLGCGAGVLSYELLRRSCHVVALDGSTAMLEAAQEIDPDKAHAIEWYCRDVRDLSFLDDASLDGIVCSSVIEYLPSPIAVFAEVARVLRPGGQFIVSIPPRWSLLRVTQRIHRAIAALAGRECHPYLSVSRLEVPPGVVHTQLVQHGLIPVESLAFDPLLPAALTRILRPSLVIYRARRSG